MPFSGKIGTNWSGQYSRWAFDESKAYMMVAKMMLEPGTQSGIPLLDAEINEQSEIFLQLLRRIVQRVYGDGTSNNGFRISQSSTNPNNNFTIEGGDGTPAGAGSIFVEGWMPINLSNIEYVAQDFESPALTTPAGSDRVDTVYIDVFYKEVDRQKDSDIVDPMIGMETSRRIALAWEVRVAEGAPMPGGYVDANNVQHWTLKLATLNRVSGNAQITAAMIIDERNTKRTMSLAAELTSHAGAVSVHDARSDAVAGRLIIRDANGRAKIAPPSEGSHIARKDTVDSLLPAGTTMLFVQTSAPSGWTKSTAHNNKALRVVSGTAGAGGSVDFTTAFSSARGSNSTGAHTHTISIGATTLSVAQMPSHTHTYTYRNSTWGGGGDPGALWVSTKTANTGSAGSSSSHTHSGSSGSAGGHSHTTNLEVKYVDAIIATKD